MRRYASNIRPRFAATGLTLDGAPSRRITLASAQHPPVEHFLVGRLFPFGKATAFYGPQGGGKSGFFAYFSQRTRSVEVATHVDHSFAFGPVFAEPW